MTVEQRAKAIYIFSLSFMVRLIGFAFVLTSAILQDRMQESIYSSFNQYTIIYILGIILFLPSVIFDVLAFFELTLVFQIVKKDDDLK